MAVFAASILTDNNVSALSRSRFGNSAATSVTANTTTGKKLLPLIETVDLGEDKLVSFFVPPDEENRQKNGEKGMKVTTFDGSGDIIWPSSFALARLIAHCPSLVNGRDILELGCGLGLVSAAACKHARPHHVAVSDCDRSVLSMAYSTCTQLFRSRASVSRCTMDWSDRTTWPNQNYDVLLASDVLYEKAAVLPLVNVLQFYLCSEGEHDMPKRAILVDPVNQVNRDAFCYAAHKAGLEADPIPFPGMHDFVLISVTPR